MVKNKYLIIITFLSIALIISVFLTLRTTIFVNRATNTSTSIALQNSYLFVSPLQAKADDKEKIRVTIFILDGRGLGVPNQVAEISVSSKVKIDQVQNITDESGKAIFDLSSNSSGQYNLSAKTKAGTLPQEVKVVFY